jgi:hypothetical protein
MVAARNQNCAWRSKNESTNDESYEGGEVEERFGYREDSGLCRIDGCGWDKRALCSAYPHYNGSWPGGERFGDLVAAGRRWGNNPKLFFRGVNQ